MSVLLPQLEKELLAAHRRLGERRGPTGWPVSRWWMNRSADAGRLASSAVLVVGALVVAIVAVVIASAGGGSGGLTPSATAGPGALAQAARAAGSGSLAAVLRPGQAWLTEEEKVYEGPVLREVPQSGEILTWATWNHRLGNGGPGYVAGVGGVASASPGFGTWNPGPIDGRGFRTSTDVLKALSGRGSGTLGGAPINYAKPGPLTELAEATGLLGDAPLGPAARAAVFRAIARLPRLLYFGRSHDPLGRPGVAVAEDANVHLPGVNGARRYRFELIFNPTRGRVLGFRTIALSAIPAAHISPGAPILSWAYQKQQVVSVEKLPSLICAPNTRPPARAHCESIVSNSINNPAAHRQPAPSPTTSRPGKSAATIVAQIKLTPPGHAQSPTGIAEVFLDGKRYGTTIPQYGIVINASGLAPNTDQNAYAVWLTGGHHHSILAGFVSPGVGPSHRLHTAGRLPTDAPNYRHLVITLEDHPAPSHPGAVILQGSLAF
jgi:hypothetical protein